MLTIALIILAIIGVLASVPASMAFREVVRRNFPGWESRAGRLLLVAILVMAAAAAAGAFVASRGNGGDEPEINVGITSHSDGDEVPLNVELSGTSAGVPPGQAPQSQAPWVYVVVRPLPDEPDQIWWVQQPATVEGDGSWSAFVFLGLVNDVPGTPFKVCAIVRNDTLAEGPHGASIPSAQSRNCVEVTRQASEDGEPSRPTITPRGGTPTAFNRKSCDEIRGTEYRSRDVERNWWKEYCEDCAEESLRPHITGADLGVDAAISQPFDCSDTLPSGGTGIEVIGTYSGDLAGKEIWVLVYWVDEERYYPQFHDACNDRPAEAADGRWNTKAVLGPSGVPSRYDLVAVVTNAKSQASGSFKSYLKTGCDQGDFPGMSTLLDGLTELHAITVYTVGLPEE